MKSQFYGQSGKEATIEAYKILGTIQNATAGKQVGSITILFFLMCEHFEVDPRDILDVGQRMVKDALSDGRGEHVRALTNYMKGELR